MTQLTSLKHLSEKRKTPEPETNDVPGHSSVNSSSNVSASSSAQTRTKQKIQRQRSRRNMNGNGQRLDLGTVNVKKVEEKPEETSLVGGFVGSISSMFFGRKGGLL